MKVPTKDEILKSEILKKESIKEKLATMNSESGCRYIKCHNCAIIEIAMEVFDVIEGQFRCNNFLRIVLDRDEIGGYEGIGQCASILLEEANGYWRLL